MYPKTQIDAFLEKLASSAPEPGGGAAAALTAATGAALVSMVANLTIGKEKYAAVQAEMEAARDRADQLRVELLSAIDEDAESFRKVMDAYKLPRATDDEKAARKAAITEALRNAVKAPGQVVRLCREVADLSKVTTEKGNVQVVTDAAIAALLADAGAQSAALNVKINLGPIGDAAFTGPLWAEIEQALAEVRAVRDDVMKMTYEKLG